MNVPGIEKVAVLLQGGVSLFLDTTLQLLLILHLWRTVGGDGIEYGTELKFALRTTGQGINLSHFKCVNIRCSHLTCLPKRRVDWLCAKQIFRNLGNFFTRSLVRRHRGCMFCVMCAAINFCGVVVCSKPTRCVICSASYPSARLHDLQLIQEFKVMTTCGLPENRNIACSISYTFSTYRSCRTRVST
jgi:hypothetical protein